MALLQQTEQFDTPVPTLSAYADDPLPSLILRELEGLHAGEAALPARSSAQARKLIVCAIVGGASCWGLVIGVANLVARLIA